MQTIDEIISSILVQEEAYTDHPEEEGGPSKFGITLKNLSGYLGRPASAGEVMAMSPALAREIYERNFFVAPKIDRLPLSIQAFVFDCALSHGPRHAIKIVQSVCNNFGYSPPLEENGAMGPSTRKAAKWSEKQKGVFFLKALIEERKRFYRQIFAIRPSRRQSFNFWMSRMEEFERAIA